MQLIDTHAHLTCEDFADDLESVLKRAKEAHLKHIVNICTDRDSLEKGLALAQRHSWIANAAATTPHDVEKLGETDFERFKQAALNRELIAIGETGLDYYYEHSNRKIQCEFLIRYLHLATECELPLIFHCREAFSDLFSIADAHAPGCRAILHCFTGTWQEAQSAIDRGWMISLSGILTFKKSVALQEAAKRIPLEHLVVETDAPYLAPQSKRGKRNEPSYLVETLDYLAHLKSIAKDEMAQIVFENARKFFHLYTERDSRIGFGP